MTTAYIYRITVAAPESMLEKANHLALLIGESADDINTFGNPSYQDQGGNLYAVISAVATNRLMGVYTTRTVPEIPAHAEGVIDIDKAQSALETINQPGGMIMIVDVDSQTALAQMGLTPVPVDLETI